MPQVKRRANPRQRGFGATDIVISNEQFVGRITPPPPVYAQTNEHSAVIHSGTPGIVYGRAAGAPEFYDVGFERDGGKIVRVETRPDQIDLY